MAATALLKFTQGSTIGVNGQALKGVIDTAVTVLNSNNTDVASWQIDLVYVDPSSSIAPATPYAFSNNGSLPTATFTPDVRGSYRFVLKVWTLPNRVGGPTDTDIRVFAVPELNGFIVPPAQLWPSPLPPLGSGMVSAKPNEMNFDGQTNGWAGDGSDDGLLSQLIRQVDNLSSVTAIQEILPVLTNDQTAFTLSHPTTSDSTVVMYVNGVKQAYGTDYIAGGVNVTYLGTPSLITADVVEFWYVTGGPLVGNNAVRQESLPVTTNGQTTFTLSEGTTSDTTVEMYLNSAKMQYGVDYFVTGTQVTYTGSISLQTTDIVEFWYIVGSIVSSGVSVTVPNGSPQMVSSIIGPPGCTISNGALSLFHGGKNITDVILGSNPSAPVLAVTLQGLGANRFYTCTLKFRCIIWQSGTRANSGSMDCEVDLYITTNGSSVATVHVQTTPNPNVSRLLTAISVGTMMTVSPSTGGFTISATRPFGVTCLARAKWWVIEFEDIT